MKSINGIGEVFGRNTQKIFLIVITKHQII